MERQQTGDRGSDLGPALGLDVGATLTKLAVAPAGEPEYFELLTEMGDSAVADRISSLEPSSVGLTGGGARRLARALGQPATEVDEFSAWGTGATALLSRDGQHETTPFLLVSLGTGTSVLLVKEDSTHRVGGTALGGGTVMGLASALCNCRDYDDLCLLAERGTRHTVDLMVSDVYPDADSPLLLAGDITASCFARLAHPAGSDSKPSREDLAAAIMGLIGENVALICSALAKTCGVTPIFFGGSTLRGNPQLRAILIGLTTALGHPARILPDGEFTGATGALEAARTKV